ncbi:NAD(P)/FAD-dependent oxidoreductase [Ectothiorhodospiraceae bacterium 2226]|nr:NAD(P)/FAD-dependent oxidoreductase [Ectothiorhodospiraceae bacterium 2226]
MMSSERKPRLVLVGNGMAGMRTIEELIARAPDAYDITVIGAEPHVNYNRILLSPVLAGEKSLDQIELNSEAWYAEHGVRLRKGVRVEQLDLGARRCTLADGSSEAYDRLLLATGSEPFILPVPGVELEGVVSFRDIADVQAMQRAARRGGRAVVIGGGLLGLEAAHGLARQGMDVTVVHIGATLMERQLDAAAGALLHRHLEQNGLRFALEARTTALLGEGPGESRVRAVALEDGRELPADLVVMAVGIRPNAALAHSAGLACERGVLVDDQLRTSAPDVYAVGECVQHRGISYGLVAPLFEQAKVCAAQLAGEVQARYEGSATATRLKVTGVDLFSAGEFEPAAGDETIVLQDPGRGIYKKLVLRDNRLRGAVLYGDAGDGPWYFRLLREATDLAPLRATLAFGPTEPAGEGGGVAALPDDAEICGCNGVCKGTIVAAIQAGKLDSLEAVRAHTKASSSCGSCTGQVQELLASVTGRAQEVVADPPLCACTDLGHDAVREQIAAQGLNSIRAVMDALGWRSEDGCHRCRPALNYYLLVAWPESYTDDAQSRFINERAHANIQKDGTYSVVPRMWGGITTPAELRAIADVAERFKVPTVKVTGGQRIDLLGVHKHDLPAVWDELGRAGLVSGHAYGKALRTVKTCVGSEWCRFGTQDSTGMGIALERMTWGSWTPHKVKLAVSGCPRNCAEATIKDFGVIAVDSGWELHVGGNGGIKLRGTELLCKVATPAEVLEYAGAFLQMYREQARYLERTAHWIERNGLAAVKAAVVDDPAQRKRYYERFLRAQRYAQKDPWQERVQDAARREFTPLEPLDMEERV